MGKNNERDGQGWIRVLLKKLLEKSADLIVVAVVSVLLYRCGLDINVQREKEKAELAKLPEFSVSKRSEDEYFFDGVYYRYDLHNEAENLLGANGQGIVLMEVRYGETVVKNICISGCLYMADTIEFDAGKQDLILYIRNTDPVHQVIYDLTGEIHESMKNAENYEKGEFTIRICVYLDLDFDVAKNEKGEGRYQVFLEDAPGCIACADEPLVDTYEFCYGEEYDSDACQGIVDDIRKKIQRVLG